MENKQYANVIYAFVNQVIYNFIRLIEELRNEVEEKLNKNTTEVEQKLKEVEQKLKGLEK